RWLRRAWQLVEFRTFLLRLNSKLWGKRLTAADSMGELCQGAILAVGGTVAAVAHRDVGKNAWQLRHVANCADLVNSTYSADGILERAWRERAPMFILGSGALADHERALLDAAGADTLLVTPIASSERAWGLLLVFLKHSSLFIQDDLELITLLAQQSAISLENMALIEELYSYSDQLEQRVEDRTTELENSREAYRRIVETAQEGIWTTDPDNRTTFVNARMAEMLA